MDVTIFSSKLHLKASHAMFRINFKEIFQYMVCSQWGCSHPHVKSMYYFSLHSLFSAYTFTGSYTHQSSLLCLQMSNMWMPVPALGPNGTTPTSVPSTSAVCFKLSHFQKVRWFLHFQGHSCHLICGLTISFFAANATCQESNCCCWEPHDRRWKWQTCRFLILFVAILIWNMLLSVFFSSNG